MSSHPRSSSRLSAAQTRGLGELVFHHPPGTFALTPASEIALQAIIDHRGLLHGCGVDWGSGIGCLAITASRIPEVEAVLGLERSRANVRTSIENARLNGRESKTSFIISDSFAPHSPEGRDRLAGFRSHTQFVLANPPSSRGDDGFNFRRVVLRDARPYLIAGGVVFLNISSQYGRRRIERLCEEIPDYRYGGVLSTSGWVPFDLTRPDLLDCLQSYAAEECRSGDAYAFVDPADPEAGPTLTARAALARFRITASSPLSQWQVHLFRRVTGAD